VSGARGRAAGGASRWRLQDVKGAEQAAAPGGKESRVGGGTRRQGAEESRAGGRTRRRGEQSRRGWEQECGGTRRWRVIELGAGLQERWSFNGFIVTLMGCEPGPVFHELQLSNKKPGHPAT
jgi:hypothetical protein